MKKTASRITVAEAQAIVAATKSTVRPMEWVPKRSSTNPQWLEFVSVCQIDNEIREDLFFRPQFRASKTVVIGAASIEYKAIYNAAITAGGERIFALDADDTPHTNRVGAGKPWYRKTLPGRFHVHSWTNEGYGYAEPLDETLDDIELLVARFLGLANLELIGGFKHPLHGTQLDLLSPLS